MCRQCVNLFITRESKKHLLVIVSEFLAAGLAVWKVLCELMGGRSSTGVDMKMCLPRRSAEENYLILSPKAGVGVGHKGGSQGRMVVKN